MKRILYLLPVLAGVFWGSVGIFVRVLTDFGMDNYTVLGSRMAVASVILFFVIFIYDRELLRIRLRDLGFFLGTGLCGMVGLNYCYNEAINQLTLSLAAVLLSLSPIFVMILSAFLFHEKITLKKVGCTALAIAGCILVSGGAAKRRRMESQGNGAGSLRGAFLRTLQRYLQRGDAKRLSYVYGLILQFTDRSHRHGPAGGLEPVRDVFAGGAGSSRRIYGAPFPVQFDFAISTVHLVA